MLIDTYTYDKPNELRTYGAYNRSTGHVEDTECVFSNAVIMMIDLQKSMDYTKGLISPEGNISMSEIALKPSIKETSH